jgi:hypothetical protein
VPKFLKFVDAKQNDSSDSIFFEGQYCYCDVLRVIKALRVIGGDRRVIDGW